MEQVSVGLTLLAILDTNEHPSSHMPVSMIQYTQYIYTIISRVYILWLLVIKDGDIQVSLLLIIPEYNWITNIEEMKIKMKWPQV